eukprot:m.152949 g.152949  ORF g.152949 m.152949 type:complete len:72 (+) comp17901_c0_seq4:1400-1615(+)
MAQTHRHAPAWGNPQFVPGGDRALIRSWCTAYADEGVCMCCQRYCVVERTTHEYVFVKGLCSVPLGVCLRN